jgi:Tol biopolymer transport system component/Ca2+-binding RTX toxin-like protein
VTRTFDGKRFRARGGIRAAAAAATASAALVAPWGVGEAVAAEGDLVRLLDRPNAVPTVSSVSGDGRFVAFESYDSGLVSGDTNGKSDVFVLDRQSGQVQMASISADGTQGDGESRAPDLSDDGRFVAFYSTAANFAAGDDNGAIGGYDVFVKDLQTGALDLASRAADGTPGNGFSYSPSISADGTQIAFTSSATDLVANDHNAAKDVFVFDRTSGTTTLESVDSSGAALADGGSEGRISGDGSHIIFQTYGPPRPPGGIRAIDVMLRDRQSGDVVPANVGVDGTLAEGGSGAFWADISDTGRFVVYASGAANLAPNDANDTYDIFRYDQMTGTSELISANGQGHAADDMSAWPTISDNGRYIAFHSWAKDLAGPPTFAEVDVYVADTVSGTIRNASRPTTGAGVPEGTYAYMQLPKISGDGSTVVFAGSAPLVAEDTAIDFHPYAYDNGAPDYVERLPMPRLTTTPATPSSDSTPTFAFDAPGAASTECSVEESEGSFTPCTSPFTPNALSDGEHTFRVRGVYDGEAGPARAFSFDIDTTGPVVSLEGGPSLVTNDASPSFPFSAEPATTFECALTPVGEEPQFEACTSPVDFSAQVDGQYTFRVRGADSLGNVGILTQYTFTIDGSSPTATIDSGPDAVSSDTTPTFGFSAEDGNTFECSLAAASGADDFAACESPSTYPALTDGDYVFKVRATDSAGNTGAAAERAFTVATAPPATACSTATNAVTGTNAPNTLRGTTRGDLMRGLGGDDTVNALRGNDCLDGGVGNDQLNANAGDDELLGGDGNDRLAAGAGQDVVVGGLGFDRVYAVDGTVDQVDCGGGANDIATVDAIDVVVNCERVRTR